MSPDDCPVGLRHLQFDGEALRPDGLLGVILLSFILLAKELANVLLGALGNTRKGGSLRVGGTRRSIITAQKRSREIGDRKLNKNVALR